MVLPPDVDFVTWLLSFILVPRWAEPANFSKIPPMKPTVPIMLATGSTPRAFLTPSTVYVTISTRATPDASDISFRAPDALYFVSFTCIRAPGSGASLTPLATMVLSLGEPPMRLSTITDFAPFSQDFTAAFS